MEKRHAEGYLRSAAMFIMRAEDELDWITGCEEFWTKNPEIGKAFKELKNRLESNRSFINEEIRPLVKD